MEHRHLIQPTTSLKEAFVIATKSGPDLLTNSQETEMSESAKKKTKIVGPMCNAPASCNSKATHKSDTSKTFFCKEHYVILTKPAKKCLSQVKPC